MNKWSKLKQAMKNPPPERLAAIEYRSHFLQGIGITVVCVILLFKGFWYIIFALIFGVGVSYSQGMNAYQRYKIFMSLKEPEKPDKFDRDISPSRRRSKIVNFVYGDRHKVWMAIASVLLVVLTVPATWSRWMLMLIYPVALIAIYIVLYFYLSYWFAYPLYKREMKEKKK